MHGIKTKQEPGYSNDPVIDLMKYQQAGPLDFSQNDSKQDGINYKLSKINNKISQNMGNLKNNHNQMEVLS